MPGSDASSSDDGSDDDLPEPGSDTARIVTLLDAALDAVTHQLDLELSLWPSAADRQQQLASLLAAFTADATEGPCAALKHRGQMAKQMEQSYSASYISTHE